MAINTGDGFAPWKWSNLREKCKQANIEVLPWRRVWNQGDVRGLVEDAELMESKRLLVNLERPEDTLMPVVVAATLEGAGWPVEKDTVGFSTEAWVPNDPDFSSIAHCPVLLQLFPEDNRWQPEEIPARERDCIIHAREKGFTYVGVTYQCYRSAPEWFNLSREAYSLYSLDDAWPRLSEWA